MYSYFSKLGLRKCTWLAGGVWILYLLVKILIFHNVSIAFQIDTGFFILVAGLVTVLLFAAAIQSHPFGDLVQTGWFLLAASYLCEVLGNFVDILTQSISSDPYANLAYLLGYSFRAVGIILIPMGFPTIPTRLRRFFNTKNIIILAVLLTWIFLILPVFTTASDNFWPAYAALYFLECFAVLDMLTKQRIAQFRLAAYWVALSVGLDIIATTLLVGEATVFTQSIVFIRDGLWMASYLAMAMAAISQMITITKMESYQAKEKEYLPIPPLERYIPALWTLVVYLIFMWSYLTHQDIISQIFLWGIGALIIVLAIRQVEATNENANLYRAAQLEISQRKTVEEQMQHDARHDMITGLPNRMYFTEQLQRSLDRARRQPKILSAVLFLDLDRFKIINDSFGHNRGDQLLGVVAERLKACVRPSDIVARFGGDEFAILVEDIQDTYEAVTIASRIQDKLSDPFELDGHKTNSSASIGIALINPAYEQPEDILRDADIAMYGAKRNGKARSEIFSLELNTRNQIQLQLESELQQAVKNGEFILYYQPTVSLLDKKISAAEALLRWRHPHRGLTLPGEFIQLAEETGLILTIGTWVLRTACAQATQWARDQHKPIKITVNLSQRQFHEPGLSRLIYQILQETGLEPSLLELEISEQTALSDIELTARILRSLGSLGIRSSIDGFGTSYAILGSLKNLSLTTLKIRQPTAASQEDDNSAVSLLSAMITTAQALHLNVVAERVETQSQLAMLKNQHINQVQGYIICPPMAEAEFTHLLIEGSLSQVNTFDAG